MHTFRLPFALTALLLVAAILWNTLRSELSQPSQPVPFVVLKRGHSGSTWLSSMLLRLPGVVYFLDDGLSKSYAVQETVLASYLVHNLREPGCKLRDWEPNLTELDACRDWSRQPVATHDCMADARCRLSAIGLSFSPFWEPETPELVAGGLVRRQGLDRVMRLLGVAMPAFRFVVLIRSNVAKLAKTEVVVRRDDAGDGLAEDREVAARAWRDRLAVSVICLNDVPVGRVGTWRGRELCNRRFVHPLCKT